MAIPFILASGSWGLAGNLEDFYEGVDEANQRDLLGWILRRESVEKLQF